MATLTLRTVKGSPLTNQEVDDNFTNLNLDIGVLSNLTTTANSNVVSAVNSVKNILESNVGVLSQLTTSATSNLVSAINEVQAELTPLGTTIALTIALG